jgi:uncharacterized protein YdaU (DUF1376 family)
MAVPFMPLYVADYMADTAHLTTVEHGAYLLLIMTYWQRGEALPDDDKKLARIVGLQGRNWKRVRQEIEPFFEFRDNKWVHQRIEHQLTVMRSQSRANSLNGKKGGLAKAKGSPSENLAKHKRTLSHTDIDIDTVEPKGSISASAKKPSKKTLPKDWFPEAFSPSSKCAKIIGTWSPSDMSDHLEHFRAHHEARGTKFENWQSAWQTWVINSDKFKPRQQVDSARGGSLADIGDEVRGLLNYGQGN